jgi:hypothetical protein
VTAAVLPQGERAAARVPGEALEGRLESRELGAGEQLKHEAGCVHFPTFAIVIDDYGFAVEPRARSRAPGDVAMVDRGVVR